nr:putative reverse transcriptase domain-containing protein [Tanacetum cinerariifolium]
MVRFGKKGKLAPRYVGPFEILERISPVAYPLGFPAELSGVHDKFYVPNLKKCLADANLHVPLNEIKIDKTLCFVEEPMEIMDREVKSLKRSKISLVKVRWNSKRGLEFTWEREDHMKYNFEVDAAEDFKENMLSDYCCQIRIEQYFLMIDYSLWEVILNGDSPAPTRVIEGVLQPIAPTTAEQRLARKNELKARGTLLMALPDKHQLKFNTQKDAKTLMEVIEKRLQKLISQLEILKESLSQEDINLKFLRSLTSEWRTHTLIWRNKTDLEEQSLDDLFNRLKIYEAKVKSSSYTSTFIQNIAFVSSSNTDSTNEPISAAASVSVISAKIPVSIDADDLEEMDLKWLMAMLIVRARRFLQKTGRNLGANGPTSMGFDMSKVECYNCHRKGHFARECSYDWSFQAEEEPTNYALMAFSSSSSSSDNELRDNALIVLRQNLEKAEQERDDLKLKLEKFQTSSKNLSELLTSQINDKTGLGYNSQVFTRSMFDYGDYCTSESDESLRPSPIYDRYQSRYGYHAVPPPYTGTFMPPKPDLVFHDAPNDVETVHTAFNVELSPTKPDNDLSYTHRPLAPIIEDWVSDSEDDSPVETSIPAATPKTAILKPKSKGNRRNRKACFQYAQMSLPNPQRHVVPTAVLTQSKLIPITVIRPVTTVVSKTNVTRPRQAKTVITKPNSPSRRHINRSPSPKASNFPPKVTAVKAPMGNPRHALKDKGVIDSGCSRHMTGNMSYLSDFKELNGGYVAFGGNPKGGKISRKGKFDGKVDEGFFVGYSVSSKPFRVINNRVRIVQATLHINFLENKPNVAEKVGEENDQQYVLFPVWSSGSNNPQNTDEDAALDEKEPEFEGRKPESEVNISRSSKFEDFFDNSINEDNAAGTLVPVVGQLSPNNTNTFSDIGPSNVAASPTHGKSSYLDSSQLLDDPNMP